MAEVVKPRRDLYAEVTNQIVAALEAGTPPWKRPWNPDVAGVSGPINGTTGRRYRGINTLLLGMSPLSFASGDPRWLTFKQAQERGWQVKKGSKAATVVFFKKVEVGEEAAGTDDDGDRRVVPVLRSYPVFHASQVEGIPTYVPPLPEEVPWRKPETAATILDASGIKVREGGDRAFYSPTTDHIQLPPHSSFAGPGEWAATALHELGHATGHPSRLARDLRGRYGSQAYAMEELRAEIASAMLATELSIPADIPQHASYIDSWLAVLRRDRRAIFAAAADAQRITDWCLSQYPAYRAAQDADAEGDNIAAVTAADEPRPSIPASVAALGPMPTHIARRLNPQPAADAASPPPPPTVEETPTWTYAPR